MNVRLWRRKMAPPVNLYTISSFLMAVLFALSASVQFNDRDWYFWIPLYTFGCAVNLLSCWPPKRSSKSIRSIGKLALWLGALLFTKVILEGSLAGATEMGSSAALWSLDMRERVVREKLGSGFVFISVVLQLAASSGEPVERKMLEIKSYFDYGIRVAVTMAITCGLSFVFLVLVTLSVIMHSASSTVVEDPNAPWQIKLGMYVDYGILVLICLCYSLSFLFTVLLVVSTVLYQATSLVPVGNTNSRKKNDQKIRMKLQAYAKSGMGALVGISYGLSLVFHAYHRGEMKF